MIQLCKIYTIFSADEEDWNEDAAAAERGKKRSISDREEEDDDNEDGEPNDLQDESGCNDENKGDEKEECNAKETFQGTGKNFAAVNLYYAKLLNSVHTFLCYDLLTKLPST